MFFFSQVAAYTTSGLAGKGEEGRINLVDMDQVCGR